MSEFKVVVHPSQVEDRHPLCAEFRRLIAEGKAIVSPPIPEHWR